MIKYVTSLETATLFPSRDVTIRKENNQAWRGAGSNETIQQAGMDLLAELTTEVLTVTPDEMTAIRIAAGNGDAIAKIKLDRLQQADNDAEETIRRDKADIARDIEKYKTPYTFGVADGRVGE